YSFTYDLNESNDGVISLWARLSPGAHLFTGSDLQLKACCGYGVIQLQKPSALPGSPDLSVTKTGPPLANAGDVITYTLNYKNRASSTVATGVGLSDTLPAMVTFVSCSSACSVVGNTISWDLGDLARGASGSVTYQVRVVDAAQAGQTFRNSALIVSAEDDANFTDNTASVVTTIITGCVQPSITTQPAGAARCVGQSVTFSVGAGGTTLGYQWRKDGSAISGATNTSYNIASIANSDAVSYDMVVSNPCGSVTSNPAILTLRAPLAVNDSYATAEDTALPVSAPGVLTNDSDVCGHGLSAVLLIGPTHRTLN